MKEKYLNQISSSLNSLAEIPHDELAKLTEKLKRKKIKKGDYFAKSSKGLKNLGFVLSGLLRFFEVDEHGLEFTKHFFCENDLIIFHQDFCGLKFGVHSYIESLEDSVLLVTKISNINQLFESHPCWHVLTGEIRKRYKRSEEKRISGLLLKDDQTRYTDFLADFPGIEKRVKKMHIASYLGIPSDLINRL